MQQIPAHRFGVLAETMQRLLLLSIVLCGGCSEQVVEERPAEVVTPLGDDPVPECYQPLYGPGISDVEGFLARLPFDSITLDRTPCFGICPVYTVSVHRDGTATLNAVEHLPKLGKFVGEVDIFDYGRLCYFIEKSRFQKLNSNYSANWTDSATSTVTVVSGPTRKEVSDYGSVGPIELWAIQEVIDSIRNKIDWQPVP